MKNLTAALLAMLPVMSMAQNFDTEIQARQEAFKEIETVLEKADDTIDGSDTVWTELSQLSRTLTTHGNTLAVSFPKGSHEGSKAKEAVWSKSEKFDSLLNQMNAGFEDMYKASQQQNVSMAKEGLQQAEGTCRGCHRTFRSRW